MATAAIPVQVSPVIKFFRWSFFGAGIIYGITRHNFLARREASLLDMRLKQRAERAIRVAEEKRIENDIQMAYLEKMATGKE